MAAKLKNIVEYLDNYLDINSIEDTCWNGLQYEGSSNVKRIALAVDASLETFERALEEDAQMVIVHHGHFWKGSDPSISGWKKTRIEFLHKHGISLYACHLPLDRHREAGNNALLLKLLGAEIVGEFMHVKGKNIGWIGKCESTITIKEIVETLSWETGADCTALPFGAKQIRTIAVCTGGGGYGGFYEALESGADLYITGDPVEIYHTAKDAGINVIFAGHHASEILGVRELAAPLMKRFDVHAEFIDLPTGL